jgi:hypothetical protein
MNWPKWDPNWWCTSVSAVAAVVVVAGGRASELHLGVLTETRRGATTHGLSGAVALADRKGGAQLELQLQAEGPSSCTRIAATAAAALPKWLAVGTAEGWLQLWLPDAVRSNAVRAGAPSLSLAQRKAHVGAVSALATLAPRNDRAQTVTTPPLITKPWPTTS